MIPIIKDTGIVGDEYASAARASFGATTSTLFDTLPEEYISQQEKAGLGRYISPDKQIDASTCMYPDNTWFVKGVAHANWTLFENDILMRVLSSAEKLTVNDFDFTQFIVYNGTDDDNGTGTAMTADNCHTENWSQTSAVKATTLSEKISLLWQNGLIISLN